ncbi:MAG: hypothetical protein KKB62_01425 [Nanoarchaeota archaeon]|nr:hypothetical protein [Nanoarchaeota archaeon]
MEEKKFLVKIVGIIFDPKTRRILVGKGEGDTKYSFIEDDLDYGLELDKKLKKAALERTGYKIHNLGAVYAENMLQREDKLKIHFLCEATEGKEKPGKDVKELLWVKPSNVEDKLQVKLPTRLQEYLLNLE